MRVGADLAKRVIQVHAVDAAGRRVVSRALKREQFMAWCAQLPAGCLVAMEACSSAHHWARKLRALGLDARLIAANFVSPYRMEGKSGKNDMTDAAAICEAASRPSMRFVPVKTCEQQGVMSLHRVREGLKEERTGCINQIRGVLAEFGLVFNKSPKVLHTALADVIEDASNELSATARRVLQGSITGASSTSTCAGATARWASTCARARRRGAPQRSSGSASSAPRRSPPAWATSISSRVGINSAPGWASFPSRTPAAARRLSGASPNAATTTFERSSSRAPSPPS